MGVRRLLIATIGENDPASQYGPMAALRTAVHDGPDLVLLVHTNATAGQAAETRRAIETAVGGTTVCAVLLPTDDATDLETMNAFLHGRLVALRRRLAQVLGRSPRPDDLTVSACGSSGTRQMGIALTLAVDAAFPWARHWTALHPQDAPAAATSPSRDPCLRAFRPGVLRHQHEIREGFQQLAECRFHEAAARFEAQMRHEPAAAEDQTRLPIQVALRLTVAFRDLGDSDLDAALAALLDSPALSAHGARAGAPPELANWLERIEGWFAPVRRAITTPSGLGDPWPAELVATALREAAGGRLPLAVARLQTALEVATRARLAELTNGQAGRGRDPWDRMLHRLLAMDPRLQVDGVVVRPGEGMRLAMACNDLDHRGRTQHELVRVMAEGHRFVDGLLFAFGWRTSAEAPTTPEAVRSGASLLADWAGLPMDEADT